MLQFLYHHQGNRVMRSVTPYEPPLVIHQSDALGTMQQHFLFSRIAMYSSCLHICAQISSPCTWRNPATRWSHFKAGTNMLANDEVQIQIW